MTAANNTTNGAARKVQDRLEIDRRQISDFVGALFVYADENTYVSLRSFIKDGDADVPFEHRGFRLVGEELGPLVEFAATKAERAANTPAPCVFCPPIATFTDSKKADEAHLANGLALSVECDAHPMEARATLESILRTATVVVESGGVWKNRGAKAEPKLHLHWRLSEPTRTPEEHARLKMARTLACALVGADASNKPMVHPIRWPGSYHRKGAPKLCATAAIDENSEIHLDEAIELLEEAVARLPKRERERVEKEASSSGEARADAELIAAIVSGADYHGPITALAARYIGRGQSQEDVKETIAGFMLARPEPQRDDRWRARFDGIARAVESALEKFGRKPGVREQQERIAEAFATNSNLFRSFQYFEVSTRGLYFCPPTGDGAEPSKPTFVCGPFEVVGRTRTDRSEDHGILLRWIDRAGKKHEHAFACRDIGRSIGDVRATLHGLGLTLSERRTAKEHFTEYLARVADHVPESLFWTRQIGLTNGGQTFVMPDRSYGKDAGNFILQSPHELPNFSHEGTLEGWREEIAARAQGNDRLVLALCVGVSGPLAALLGEETGGFNIHGDSSSGKTTAMQCGASSWGRGETRNNGFVRSWRTTDNGMEGVAASHNETLLVLDELHQADPRVIDQLSYMLANQSGKQRANMHGEARGRTTWRVPYLSSGECSFADRIREASQSRRAAKAGQVVRCIDVPADAGAGVFNRLHGFKDGAALSDALKVAARTHFGYVGPAFVKRLMQDTDEHADTATGHIAAFMAEIEQRHGRIEPQAARVARRFALAAAAGELLTEFDLTGWPEGEARRALLACFDAWATRYPLKISIEKLNGAEAIADAIRRRGAQFQPIGRTGATEGQRFTGERLGFRRPSEFDPDQFEYLFFAETFGDISGNATATAQALDAMGALDRDGRQYGKKATKPEGRLRFYIVRGNVLLSRGEDEADDGL